ncbi:hypothetical protein L484_011231 [Morus notabilis]|uniref:Uncharacterized protein n=1 Tax=Morus notabilis TaxID=981085 RepID=W9RUK2_9ROSA|nr:hypothetical protein L484_011231 [Morus notabilis]
MAKLNIIIFSFLILLTLLLHISSSSAARLLITNHDAATERLLNLALPRNAGGRNQEDAAGHVLPCNTGMANRRAGMEFQVLWLCAKPGQLLLSMLPKGFVPPSGPSRRTNDNNN